MCSEEQAEKQIKLLEKLVGINTEIITNRPQVDETYYICDTQSQWFLDYKNRKHIYVFSPNALTLKLNDLGTISIPAEGWCDVSFRQGMQIFTSGQATLVPVYVRSTDQTITGAYSGSPSQITGTVTANAGTNLNTSALALESGGHLQTIDTNTAASKTDLDTIVTNTNKIPASPATETGHLATIDTSTAGSKTDLDTIAGAISAGRMLTTPPANQSINNAQVAGTTTSVNQGTADAGTQRVIQAGAATGTKSNVAGSASSVTILASNTSRKGALIYNDSTAILYLDLSGGTASNSSYSVQLAAGAYFELPGPTVYNGAITGIWASATGNARVTEFS